jgi:hypothetical protein
MTITGHVVGGLGVIAMSIWAIARRGETSAATVRFQNRFFAALRMQRRYDEREIRHNVAAAWVCGIFGIALGVFILVAG